jgi:hypothetical protein
MANQPQPISRQSRQIVTFRSVEDSLGLGNIEQPGPSNARTREIHYFPQLVYSATGVLVATATQPPIIIKRKRQAVTAPPTASNEPPTVDLTWTVENFQEYFAIAKSTPRARHLMPVVFATKDFETDVDGLKCKWQLGLQQTLEDDVGIFLKLVEVEAEENATIIATGIELRVQGRGLWNSSSGRSYTHRFQKQGPFPSRLQMYNYGLGFGVGLTWTCPVSKRFGYLLDNGLIVNDKMVLTLTATFKKPAPVQGAILPKVPKLEREHVVEDSADLTIVVPTANGDVKIKAHQAILKGTSSIFTALINTQMVNGELTIQDVPAAAMKLLIKFIYTGSFQEGDSWEGVVKDLIYASDKYQIQGLKTFITENIVFACTPGNVLELLRILRDNHLDAALESVKAYAELHSDLRED